MDTNELSIYTRQVHPDLLSREEQLHLKQESVFILGLGGLGSSAAAYLAAAGVGTLVLCDRDIVEVSNLNRQVLHAHDRLGMSKADSAKKTLSGINPYCRYISSSLFLESVETAASLAQGCSVLVDCTDNIDARILLSRTSKFMQVPLVHGGIRGWSGQVSVFFPEDETALESLLPREPVPGVTPVIGAAAGVIGAMEAMETIKILLGKPSELRDKVLVYDGLTGTSFSYRK